MTSQALAPVPISGRQPSPEALMEVLANGNIEALSGQEKLAYLEALCRSLSLNPLTRPFQYLELWDKGTGRKRITLYATKDCTEQLRKLHGISARIVDRSEFSGCWVVTAQATDKTGRTDESIGAVSIEGLKGDNLANALMKAETKSKRRVTLSICGLGMLDETEIETIPDARTIHVTTEQPAARTRASDQDSGSPDEPPPPAATPSPAKPAPRPDRPSAAMRQPDVIPTNPNARITDPQQRAAHKIAADRLGWDHDALHALVAYRYQGVAGMTELSRSQAADLIDTLQRADPAALRGWLRAATEAPDADADALPFEPCPRCGEASAWGEGGCTQCGFPAEPAEQALAATHEPEDPPEADVEQVAFPELQGRPYHDDRGRS